MGVHNKSLTFISLCMKWKELDIQKVSVYEWMKRGKPGSH